jgi:predicted dehydrogenase
MRRIRIGILGAGAATEWAIIPALSGPDATQPPDIGAWWGRRPLSSSDIRYQAPARPDIVALCDPDGERAERVASSARIRAVYSDWRLMLREVPLDALICATNSLLSAEVVTGANAAVKWLWVDGPPAPSSLATQQLQKLLAGRANRVWCAPSLRLAWAHRAASRAVERGRIGAPLAFHFRWPFPLCAPNANTRDVSTHIAHDSVHLSSSYAAFDLLLALAAHRPENSEHNENERYGFAQARPLRSVSSRGACVSASENGGATSLLIQLAGGVQATALFASADSWNAPLPRVEICGTQGRSLVCEAGRRMWLHQPREATEFREPPGLAPNISAANVLGVAENLKAFLAACAADGEKTHSGKDVERVTETSLRSAFHALHLLESAGQSLRDGASVKVEPGHHDDERTEHLPSSENFAPAASAANLTLPL